MMNLASQPNEQPCYRSCRTHVDAMTVRQALAELERALARDAECSFIGMGEGVVEDRRGHLALAILLPLTPEQVATLKRRVPEVRAFESMGERLS